MGLIFVTLCRFRKKPTKAMLAQGDELMEKLPGMGCEVKSFYWTLGRYDAVCIHEAPDEKAAMKASILFGDIQSSETLVAVPAEEASKLVD